MLAGLSALGAGALARPAAAAVRGRFRLTRKVVRESGERWRILMTISLEARPPSPTVEVEFDFRLVAVVEEQDGKKRKRRVDPPRLVTRQRAVDFTDPQGRVGRTARAELVIERSEGFEPGEWALDLRGPDGPIGARAGLVLRGVAEE